MIAPFQIPYDADQTADLRGRLARTRWADAVTDDWIMGTERGFLNQFIDFWRDGYDWAQRRDRLNQLPHFRTTVDGHGTHFLHFRSGQSGSIPLLLMNGWPSSFVEFQRIAIEDAKGLTASTGNEYAFEYGRSIFGGRGATAVYGGSSDETAVQSHFSSLMSGIYYREIQFHMHPNPSGRGLSYAAE